MTILDQPQSQFQPLEYASFGERLVARFIDLFILLIPSVLIPFIFPWLYYALQEGGNSGATIGKRAMGIRVVSVEGQPIGFGTATGRFVGNFLTLFTFFIGYLLMFFNARNQCLHDMITSTVVIKNRTQPFVQTPPSTRSTQQKRSWTNRVGPTETHFVEINPEGGRHWHRTSTTEHIKEFTLWQLTDGMVDLSAEFGEANFAEMKEYAALLMRNKV